LATDQVVVRPVTLEAGTCYRVLVAGEGAVEDVDLRLLVSGNPDPLRADESTARDATLGVVRPLCPETSAEHSLEIAMTAGAGGVAWRLFRRGTGGGVVVPENLRIGGESGDFIASRIRRRHGEAGEGRPPVTDVMRIDLESGNEHAFRFATAGEHCYVVLAAAVPSLQVLHLTLLDPHGIEADRAETQDGFPSARICAPVDGEWTAKIRAFRGYGEAGVQVFGSRE
jgi:hypothetical protein